MKTDKNNLEIRKYHPTDFPYLYKICLETADSGKDATNLYKNPFLVGQFFAAPYVFYEPELTFVLTLNQKPSGYVLGTSNTKNYSEWLNSYWLPILRKRFPKHIEPENAYDNKIITLIHSNTFTKPELQNYPAHLHINLLPEVQGLGMGKKLIFAYVKKLKEIKIKGLHLEVGKKNINAVNFYERVGFTILKEYEKSIAFVMNLTK